MLDSHLRFDVRHGAQLPLPSDEGPLDYRDNVPEEVSDERQDPSAGSCDALVGFVGCWNKSIDLEDDEVLCDGALARI